MNNDLISREALKNTITEEFGAAFQNGDIMLMSKMRIYSRVLAYIDNAPAVEPFERIGSICEENCGYRPQGKWIDEGQYAEGHSEHAYLCKNCGYQIIELPNMIFENRFCKYCGADMKGGAE